MSDNKRTGRSFNGKGYYIALILCAAAIGISGYLYYQNTVQQEANLMLQEEPQEQQMLQSAAGTEALEAIATQPPATQSTTPPSQSATQPTEKKVLKTAAPVDGQTMQSYAMDCLSYPGLAGAQRRGHRCPGGHPGDGRGGGEGDCRV